MGSWELLGLWASLGSLRSVAALRPLASLGIGGPLPAVTLGVALLQTYAVVPREIAPVDAGSSCTAEAAADVNRGTAFLLALAPLDARKAFERAAGQDPDCAMAGWGRAMSWLPSDPASFTEVAQRAGRDAVRRAAGRGTAREQAYVGAIAMVFDQAADGSLPMRLRRYHDAMRNLAAAHPEDSVATLFLARASLMLSTAPDDDFQRDAASLIERRFGALLDQRAPEQRAAGRPAPPQPTPNPSAPGQPASAQPTPNQPAPASPAPGQPASGERVSAQPPPAQPTPNPSAPGQSASAQPAPSQPGSTQSAPNQPAPSRPAPNQLSPNALAPALTLLLARDRPTAPQLAKPAADIVARLATTPLARHLPARTYARLGDWDAAVTSTEAAIALAGSPASSELVYGPDRTEVAAEWLLDALLQQGRVARAAALTADLRRALATAAAAAEPASAGGAATTPAAGVNGVDAARVPPTADSSPDVAATGAALRAALVRMDMRRILARADWTRGREWVRALGCDRVVAAAEAVQRPRALASFAFPAALDRAAPFGHEPSSGGPSAEEIGDAAQPPSSTPAVVWSPDVLSACAFVGAYSAARLAWPGAKADRLEDAARLAEPLGGMGTARSASVRELLRVLVRAAIAAGQEEHPELELLASHAVDLEERLMRSGQLVLPFAPAHELLGDLFLQANRFDQARRHYRDALMAWPNRARSILGTARASVRLDDRDAATAAYRRLLELWDDADPDLPELLEARRWLDVAPRPAAP